MTAFELSRQLSHNINYLLTPHTLNADFTFEQKRWPRKDKFTERHESRSVNQYVLKAG